MDSNNKELLREFLFIFTKFANDAILKSKDRDGFMFLKSKDTEPSLVFPVNDTRSFRRIAVSKIIRFFIWGLSLSCIVIGVLGVLMSARDLKSTEGDRCMLKGEIISRDYNQYVKNGGYYFEVRVDGELIALEIPDSYVSKFKKSEFDKTYSLGNIYTFVVLQEDYNKYGVVPVLGMKNDSCILLDENDAMENMALNARIGLIISSLFAILGIILAFSRCFWVLKRHREYTAKGEW